MISRSAARPSRSTKRRRAHVLLADARRVLAQWQRFHFASVTIGRCEQAGLPELCEIEARNSAATVEDADRLCAEIARHLCDEQKMLVGLPSPPKDLP